MLNYNNSTKSIKVFNRNGVDKLDKLTFSIEGRRILKCDVISITPRYIYFSCKDIGILQTGRYEYQLLANDSIEIDRGILNLDFSTKLITPNNNIINYGTKQ